MTEAAPMTPIPGPDPGACPECGDLVKAGMLHYYKDANRIGPVAPGRCPAIGDVGAVQPQMDRGNVALPHSLGTFDREASS